MKKLIVPHSHTHTHKHLSLLLTHGIHTYLSHTPHITYLSHSHHTHTHISYNIHANLSLSPTPHMQNLSCLNPFKGWQEAHGEGGLDSHHAPFPTTAAPTPRWGEERQRSFLGPPKKWKQRRKAPHPTGWDIFPILQIQDNPSFLGIMAALLQDRLESKATDL